METVNEFSVFSLSGHRIYHYRRLTSTNIVLEDLRSEEGAAQGTVVMADYQTQGRGLNANKWRSDAGKNLLISFLHYPTELSADRQFFIGKVAALAVLNAIQDFVSPDYGRVKWPNDVLISGKKAAGILIQNSLRGNRIQYAAIGIGINVNQRTFKGLPHATSLIRELKCETDRSELLRSVLENLDEGLRRIDNGEFKRINQLYYSNLFGYLQWLDFQSGNRVFNARIREVKDDGLLVLENREGTLMSYNFKEIIQFPVQPNPR